MKATVFNKILLSVYQSAWCHIKVAWNLQCTLKDLGENLKQRQPVEAEF